MKVLKPYANLFTGRATRNEYWYFTLLITLKHQDNAQQTLEQLSDIFLGYATGAISQSSGEIAYSDDNRMFIKVDIEEFLSKPEQSN